MTKFDEILETLLRPITSRIEVLMATAEELQAQVTEVKTSLTDAIERVQVDVDNLKDQLSDRIDPNELNPISQGLSDLKSSLDALDPDPSNPPPEQPTP